jgi:hypothetical protein
MPHILGTVDSCLRNLSTLLIIISCGDPVWDFEHLLMSWKLTLSMFPEFFDSWLPLRLASVLGGNDTCVAGYLCAGAFSF